MLTATFPRHVQFGTGRKWLCIIPRSKRPGISFLSLHPYVTCCTAAKINQANAKAVLLAVLIGFTVPSALLLTMQDPTVTALWNIFPFWMWLAQMGHLFLRPSLQFHTPYVPHVGDVDEPPRATGVRTYSHHRNPSEAPTPPLYHSPPRRPASPSSVCTHESSSHTILTPPPTDILPPTHSPAWELRVA